MDHVWMLDSGVKSCMPSNVSSGFKANMDTSIAVTESPRVSPKPRRHAVSRSNVPRPIKAAKLAAAGKLYGLAMFRVAD